MVYDVTQRSSFEALDKWMGEVRDSTNNKYHVLLLGNKIDLKDDRTVSTLEGEQYAEKNEYKFFETSAKTNENECVDTAFHHLIGEITERVVIQERQAFEEEILTQRKKTIKFNPEVLEKRTCC